MERKTAPTKFGVMEIPEEGLGIENGTLWPWILVLYDVASVIHMLLIYQSIQLN